MVNLSPRISQNIPTASTPMTTAYVSTVNSDYTVELVTAGGQNMTASYYSSFQPVAGQTVHYVVDNKGNTVVIGAIADAQSKSVSMCYANTSLLENKQNSVIKKIKFNSPVYDDLSTYNTTSHKFIAPIPGVYEASATVGVEANTTGYRQLYIVKETAAVQTGTYTRASTTVTVTITGHGYSTGHVVLIDDVGATYSGQINGIWTITVVNSNTFTFTTPTTGTIASEACSAARVNVYVSTTTQQAVQSGIDTWMHTTGMCKLNKGERLYVAHYDNSGSNLAIRAVPTTFSVKYIGPA